MAEPSGSPFGTPAELTSFVPFALMAKSMNAAWLVSSEPRTPTPAITAILPTNTEEVRINHS